jgi:hypothetical protein
MAYDRGAKRFISLGEMTPVDFIGFPPRPSRNATGAKSDRGFDACGERRATPRLAARNWRRTQPPHPEEPAEAGVSKDGPEGGACRVLWNVLRDAPSALLRTRFEGGLGVTATRKWRRNPLESPVRVVEKENRSANRHVTWLSASNAPWESRGRPAAGPTTGPRPFRHRCSRKAPPARKPAACRERGCS